MLLEVGFDKICDYFNCPYNDKFLGGIINPIKEILLLITAIE